MLFFFRRKKYVFWYRGIYIFNNVYNDSSNIYYTTFEVQSGDRMEFKVSGKEYGMLVEGDKGNLIFQGTRYHGFDRER